MNFLKYIFHCHKKVKTTGYGYTRYGLGSYDYYRCSGCPKIFPGISNFRKDENLEVLE